ncbi:folate family ECF transporter S component, partial [Lachnospiraceae bacterium OttesenSCG-928-J05]|nr:folate family ECF transporter S component [Lachnospiraceae bacterium OttesenSCG-928-J05]
MKEKKKMNVNMLVMLGLLTAMEVVLSRFLSISAWNIKIGFSFVPVVIAAIMYGPFGGGAVAALGDFVGAILFPIGAYFPGFTLTAFLMGAIHGVFLHKKQDVKRITAAVCMNQFGLSLFLNSLWISILYTSAYLPLLGTRAFQSLLLSVIQVVVIGVMTKTINVYLREQ